MRKFIFDATLLIFKLYRINDILSGESEVIRDIKRDQGNATKPKDIEAEDGTCIYDGIERILYWADSISEIAFVIPSLRLQSYPLHGIGKSIIAYL